MRAFWPPFFPELAIGDLLALLLAFSIAFFLSLAVLLAVLAILLRISNTRKAARWERLEAEWEPKILEIFSGGQAPVALWRRVKNRDTLYFIDFLLRYARRLRGTEREALSELARPFLVQVAEGTKRGSPARRAWAVHALGTLGLQHYARRVIAALDDPSPLVAMVAALSLARREHPEYAEAVLTKLHRFEIWDSHFLSSMLASVGPEAAPALRKTLADSERPPRVRAVSAEALQKLSDFSAADVATQVLETETDRDILAASLRLLGDVGRPEHLSRIRGFCASADFAVRAHALRALGRLGGAEEIPRLRSALEDASPWVAIQVAWGLKEAGGTEALREIAASDHPRADAAREALTEDGC